MKITEIKSERAGDSYFKILHDSGLTVYVYPKEGYRSAYAIIGTKYGSWTTAKRSPFRTVSPITSSTSCSKAPRATRSRVMPRPARAPTPIPALKRPAIYFPAPIILTRALKFSSTLFAILISRRRPSPRSRALSVKKSKCTTILPTGA